jgi:hypothetical protein
MHTKIKRTSLDFCPYKQRGKKRDMGKSYSFDSSSTAGRQPAGESSTHEGVFSENPGKMPSPSNPAERNRQEIKSVPFPPFFLFSLAIFRKEARQFYPCIYSGTYSCVP